MVVSRAPVAPIRRAVALPMPGVAPVRKAIFPFKSHIYLP